MSLLLGICLAALCAAATNVAYLLKHRGAVRCCAVSIRNPVLSARALLSQRWFALGMLVAAGAFALHVAALALAPLSVVQATIAGGLALLAVLAERLFGLPVGRRQWAGVALVGAGLALLAVTVPAGRSGTAHHSLAAIIVFEAGLACVGAVLALGPRVGWPERHHGLALGAATGMLFGASDVAVKALTGASLTVGAVVPWLALAGACAVCAFYLGAMSLQRGEPIATIAVTSLAANVSGIAGGFVVFGDPMPAGTLEVLGHVAALGLVVAACAMMPAPTRVAAPSAP